MSLIFLVFAFVAACFPAAGYASFRGVQLFPLAFALYLLSLIFVGGVRLLG